jgi:hypothetical protein
MKKVTSILIALAFIACNNPSKVLYESDTFTVYPDKVVEGSNEAHVLSNTSMKSNYKSPSEKYNEIGFAFKFAINAKDNEMDYGIDHYLQLSAVDELETPIINFGVQEKIPSSANAPFTDLRKPIQVTFQLDMTKVLKAFEEKGYYTGVREEKIYEKDFQGVWIAGSANPLTWDFNTLYERNDLKLSDEDGDGIYTLVVDIKPSDFLETNRVQWDLSEDISMFPKLETEIPLLNANA